MPTIQAIQAPILAPRVQVTIIKTIKRTTVDGNVSVSSRYTGSRATIDLTPWISDQTTIQTSKNIKQPAGAWSIVLCDSPLIDAQSFETLYGLIEPMDGIEIRFTHGVATRAAMPPVVMRGFISKIRRSNGIGPDGTPSNFVIMTGQDYGKLWQQLQVLYWPGYVLGQDLISGFSLYEKFGIGFTTSESAQDYVQQVLSQIINPYVGQLMPSNSVLPTAIKAAIGNVQGNTSISGIQNAQGTIYNLLTNYTDVGVWNELFIQDQADGVYLVFRPKPAIDVNGNLIDTNAVMPAIATISDSNIVSIDVERSDENVANYFWVRAPLYEYIDDIYRQQYAMQGDQLNTVFLENYLNTAVSRYGVRIMQQDTQLAGDDVEQATSGLPAGPQADRSSLMTDWIGSRRAIMVAQNKDNVLLEDGGLVICGDETIQAGTYARVNRGQMSALYYVEGVSHTITPFRSFTTTLEVDRGLGFVERIEMGSGKQSPYLAERTPRSTT